MAFFALFGVIFWRQKLSSILSFVKNPFPTASRYSKMSSKNTQPVKNLSEVNSVHTLVSIVVVSMYLFATQFFKTHVFNCLCSISVICYLESSRVKSVTRFIKSVTVVIKSVTWVRKSFKKGSQEAPEMRKFIAQVCKSKLVETWVLSQTHAGVDRDLFPAPVMPTSENPGMDLTLSLFGPLPLN